MKLPSIPIILFIVALVLIFFHPPAFPAGPSPPDDVVILPMKDLFRPLTADPKEPRFAMGIEYAWASSRDTTYWVPTVGATIGLIRWPGATPDDGLQINLSGGVFALFDLGTPSSDLIDADYVIGFPVTFRRDRFSGRFRLYHQSSHLGDEFVLHADPPPVRLNLNFESLEMILSYEYSRWRVYGGGEYLFAKDPGSLKSGILHAGAEYRHPIRRLSQSGLGRSYWVAALDIKAWEQNDWAPAWSGKTGLEFDAIKDGEKTGRQLSFLITGYHGFAPYGQFFNENVSSIGFEVELGL
jgi:hypothetical protein